MEKVKPILIIDDKQVREQFSSKELLLQLNPVQKELIDFRESSVELWKFNKNEDDFIFFSEKLFSFKYVFLHDSYDNPALKYPLLLIDKLAPSTKVVLFSGNRSEALKPNDNINYALQYKFDQRLDCPHFEIRRSVYYNNFKLFIDTYLQFGEFVIEALYDSNYNHKKSVASSLFHKVFNILEESEIEAANSQYFKKFFKLAGYSIEEIEIIQKNYSGMGYREFMDAMNSELKNF